jgi:ribonuclease P protein component
MLIRRHRFHGYGSLKRVYSSGRTVRGSIISLRYLKRDPKRPYRAAVVVSAKVSKSAVTRNRIRRRVYEIIRANEDSIKPGTDLIFTVYSDKTARLEAAELKTQITTLLKQIG